LADSRYYNINGRKWEARFFTKGETFPETQISVPRQGVWGRPLDATWEESHFLGYAWRLVDLNPDLLFFPESK
jgi:hypothetical protein